ncbi:MAG: PrgI family protein [Candidatus Nomurabacteria bacterium]|nr:PrgI family protein [Candidatus Nomurabacteria bacterium]
MQFKVPQFLEIEDKIFGPFTFKEFVYLVGGAGICYILYKALGLLWGAIPILIIGGFSAALTFYHPNGKPFLNMVESAIKYLLQSKLYIWKRRDIKITTPTLASPKGGGVLSFGEGLGEVRERRLSGSKLRDLAWSLDVLDLKK